MIKKIYVADDEMLVADFFGGYLRQKGFEVRTQTQSVKVIQDIREYAPDVLFLDYRMTPLTGVDILERMKVLRIDIPVILMSAYKRREGVFEMKRLGAVEYIGKPFDFHEVDAILERLNSLPAAK